MQHCHSRIVPDLSFSLWITRCILSSKKLAQTSRKWREASPLAGKIVLSCEKYLARRYFTSPLMRSIFFLLRKGGGGFEPLNRDSVRDISKLVARDLSLQRSGTKEEALSPLIFLEKSNIYSKYWVSWRVLVTFKSSFYYFLYCLGRGTAHELRSLVRDTFSTRR